MKTIRYQKMTHMQPRDGVRYATTYVKQTLDQRKELCNWIRQVITEIGHAVDQRSDLNDFILQPLKGFKTTRGMNRSLTDLLADMANEAAGEQRNGLPKDFALAPIERWNRIFEGTAYAITLVQTHGAPANTFNSLIQQNNDIEV